MARLNVTYPSVVTPAVAALAAAIPRRHTHRQPFAPAPVAEVLAELRDAVRLEGAVLASVTPHGQKMGVGYARPAAGVDTALS